MNDQDPIRSSLSIASVQKIQRYLSLKCVFLSAALLRALLLAYGEWQDANFSVKFTDVDYHVFSDAARHVVEWRSPFLRPTYRYTPLLAFLLTMNHYLFYSFGKVLFICCDLCAGLLIQQILSLRKVERVKIVVSVSLWLLNPLTATVSSRGNAESVLAVLVLLTFYFVMLKRLFLSAVFFGIAVHMKIFPIIYLLPLFLFINEDFSSPNADLGRSDLHPENVLRKFFSPQRVHFAFLTASTFLVITAFSYLL